MGLSIFRIHYFQHVAFEGLGIIREWTQQRDCDLNCTAFYQPDWKIPDLESYDALIIMGGPMGICDEQDYPWLSEEKAHIRAAIEAGKPILGICLGAQLIAAALGAKVSPMPNKEIGWFPVAATDEGAGHPILNGINYAMDVLHWHGDRFEIPAGTLHLMSSSACDNQAFVYDNRVLGLQFHLEMDESSIQKIITACGDDLIECLTVQSTSTLLKRATELNTRRVLFQLLDNWKAA
jgi:GMP synthase-like glutamine amidotransferase